MGSTSPVDTSAKRRSLVVEWLNSLFPDLNIPLDASEEELRVQLFDGTILCGILNRHDPSSLVVFQNQRDAYMSSEQRQEKLRKFLSAVEGIGLNSFNETDLDNGSFCAVVDCLLSLRDHLNSKPDEGYVQEISSCGNQKRIKWVSTKDDRGAMDASQGNLIQCGKTCPIGEAEKKKNCSESRLHSPVMPEKTTSLCYGSHNFHELFLLKQRRYSDISASKISEIIKSNNLDNAPTQSLLSVISGILDESNNRNGELPLRVARLLRKIVQEIECRISTQAAHIRNQNNLIKAREEKYHSRIKALEALAAETNEETKVQKSLNEENKKQEQQHVLELMKEKENSDQIISELKKELETKINKYEHRCQQLEVEAKNNEARLQERIKEVEFLLLDSSKSLNDVEALSESKFENCNKKEHVLHNFISFQLQSLKNLRTSLESIKVEVFDSQKKWSGEINNMWTSLKVLVYAAESYHTVLAENRKLHNEVQELKGNIRVYCRIRPFLPLQNAKLTTVDYIGDNGELVLANPSKQGKDGQRMFKFNKVFGPTATQVQVFLEIQPLVRSVLDGYNVCIFAYGQTGSGKTYTMSGPGKPSEDEWGVNYRALNDLFHLSQVRRNTYTYEIGVQMVEIYNEQIRDLLSSSNSHKRLGILSSLQPHGLAVPDASMIPVKSTSDVLGLMEFGQTNRAVGSTALNERSSRSHSILSVHVRGVDLKTSSTSRGCLHLIDLSGSERINRSEVVGDRLKEAQHINKSLSALGDVIFALSQKSAHVPYRNSKLTQILQSSLGGRAKTLMFVQINPDRESYSETLSTLKFAERVSGVELGAARSNKEGKDVKDLIEQVASLKDTIARKDDEFEQLQMLKDLRTQSPKSNTLRRNSSSSGLSSSGEVTQQDENFRIDDESGDYGDAKSGGRLCDLAGGDLSLDKRS